MATRTATVTLTGAGPYRFEAVMGSGHTFVFDVVPGASGQGAHDAGEPVPGAAGTDAGPRPAEVMGAALGACTAMEVLAILRGARQDVRRYEVRVTGDDLDEHPNDHARFDVVHVVDGDHLDPEAVHRAIDHSSRRYCALGRTLAPGVVEVHHAYLLRDDAGDERYAEVLVVGRDARPNAGDDRPDRAEPGPPSGG